MVSSSRKIRSILRTTKNTPMLKAAKAPIPAKTTIFKFESSLIFSIILYLANKTTYPHALFDFRFFFG